MSRKEDVRLRLSNHFDYSVHTGYMTESMDKIVSTDTKTLKRYFKCVVRQFRAWLLKILLLTLLLVAVVMLAHRRLHLHYTGTTENRSKISGDDASGSQCPDVLSNMGYGRWLTRPLTAEQEKFMTNFLSYAQERFNLPPGLQRTDGLCGNVTFTGSDIATWFRALCDPRGPTPCCYHNQCAMKSVEECVCEDCYDMRHMKHAEYSTWTPSHPTCPYKEHSPQEACRILEGSSITFAGDSVLRHVYTAMLLIATGDMEHGALLPMAKTDVRDECSGMYMFTEKACRNHLIPHYKLCKGSVELKMKLCCDQRSDYNFKRIAESLWKPRSLLIAGMGIHAEYDSTKIVDDFLQPLLTYLGKRKSGWPKLLWAESHAPGIMKSPVVLSQTKRGVTDYNAKMELFLERNRIPIFRTFNLTDGMVSFDGEHYGMGVNIVKANLLLSYIDEMKRNKLW